MTTQNTLPISLSSDLVALVDALDRRVALDADARAAYLDGCAAFGLDAAPLVTGADVFAEALPLCSTIDAATLGALGVYIPLVNSKGVWSFLCVGYVKAAHMNAGRAPLAAVHASLLSSLALYNLEAESNKLFEVVGVSMRTASRSTWAKYQKAATLVVTDLCGRVVLSVDSDVALSKTALNLKEYNPETGTGHVVTLRGLCGRPLRSALHRHSVAVLAQMSCFTYARGYRAALDAGDAAPLLVRSLVASLADADETATPTTETPAAALLDAPAAVAPAAETPAPAAETPAPAAPAPSSKGKRGGKRK